MLELSLTEKLMYSTVRIECKTEDGVITGTGFAFAFKDSDNMRIPVIVANKHIIKNALKSKFTFTLADNNGNPNHKKHFNYETNNIEELWIMHPEEEIDLCVMPIGGIVDSLKDKGKKIFMMPIEEHLIPGNEYLNNLTAVEDICMIGYPNGIWDSVNNLPITIKGITATHPKFDYNGKSEFLINAANFPGSIGSPVFLMNNGTYTDRRGDVHLGDRVALLGILQSDPRNLFIDEGKTLQTSIQNDLSLVIKANKLLDFKEDVIYRANKK